MTTITQSFRPTRTPSRALLFSLPVAVAVCYLMSPYVALYRLSEALRAHDCAVLRTAIDWNRVRASIRTELAGTEVAQSATVSAVKPASAITAPAPADDDLPAFGESFASTAVGNALQTDITPENVAAMLHDHPVTMVNTGGSLLGEVRQAVDWAFFCGPRTFEVWVRPDHTPGEKPVRLKMAFTRQHGWRVIDVWLPQDMLGGGGDAAHST
jgi:hypothetical protein